MWPAGGTSTLTEQFVRGRSYKNVGGSAQVRTQDLPFLHISGIRDFSFKCDCFSGVCCFN